MRGFSAGAWGSGFGAVLLSFALVICWSFLLSQGGRSRLGSGRFCLRSRSLYVGASRLVSLAPVRGGTSFLCPTTATKKQKQRKRLQTLVLRLSPRTAQFLARNSS